MSCGNVCDTCPFYFERLPGISEAGSPATTVVDELRAGVDQLTTDLLDAISPVVPEGTHTACLLEASPRLVWPGRPGDYFTEDHADLFGFDSQWGLPHHPRTPYYRMATVALSEDTALFEFI